MLSKDFYGTKQIIKYADGKVGYTKSNIENSVEFGYVQPTTFNGKSRDPEFETYSSGREFFRFHN